MADLLAAEGAEWPVVGASVMRSRARLQLDVHAFAGHLGLSTAEVQAAEAGLVSPYELPEELLAALTVRS